MAGRFKRGELYFERVLQEAARTGAEIFSAELELTADGYVTMRNALPESGTNHDTALAHLVAEMLGFTSRDRIRVIWGDSDLAPVTGRWHVPAELSLYRVEQSAVQQTS